jgi:pimeloyl-ACP methyl ester carboxylesterase
VDPFMPKMEVNGAVLHYHVQGDGVPIVFIHPPILTSETFNYQRESLSDEFRIVTFDIRGHGHSDPSKAPLTYPLIAEDMTRLLDALDIGPCFVCGYSTGATVALEAMLTYPARYRGGILLSGMSEISDPWNRARLRAAIAAARLPTGAPISAAIAWGNADMGITYRNLYNQAKRGCVRHFREYCEYSLRYSCTDRLRYLKQPILLVYGTKDRAFFRYADILKAELKNRETYLLKGVGHQLPTKAPRRVNELIRRWVRMQAGVAAGRDEAGIVGKAEGERRPGHVPPPSSEYGEQPQA